MLKVRLGILFFLVPFILTAVPCQSAQKQKQYKYTFENREFGWGENLRLIGILYPLSWVTYYATQPSTFSDKGSFKVWRRNFGELVFDKDEPFWNWMVHPLSGAHLYLFFRSYGYDRLHALMMTAIQSALFEFTVEIYTEKASVPDLYQTPILGSILGFGMERLSMTLLNSGNGFFKVLGHVVNPWTLFWWYDGKVMITPKVSLNSSKKLMGVNLHATF